jgi:hypothetical protein
MGNASDKFSVAYSVSTGPIPLVITLVKSQLFPREKIVLAEHLEKACFEQRALKHSSHVAFTADAASQNRPVRLVAYSVTGSDWACPVFSDSEEGII